MSGWRGPETFSRNRRLPLRINKPFRPLACLVLQSLGLAQAPAGPPKVTLDQAIQLALQHNHSLQATRTTVQQSLANEVTANLRPNPTLFTDWEYLPLISGAPNGTSLASYLQASTE